MTPVKSTGSWVDGAIGRQLTHITSSPLPTVDKPDRTKHVKWEPRRMTWGGRNFVWKEGKGTLDMELCEIKREWPQPGSKTGKMLDECFEPIVHSPGGCPLAAGGVHPDFPLTLDLRRVGLGD